MFRCLKAGRRFVCDGEGLCFWSKYGRMIATIEGGFYGERWVGSTQLETGHGGRSDLTFGTCPTIFAIYTGAIIYKDPSKMLVITVCLFLLLTFFKILMIALGTFMLIYFEEDQQLRMLPSVLFIIGGVLGFLSATEWIGGFLIIKGAVSFLNF